MKDYELDNKVKAYYGEQSLMASSVERILAKGVEAAKEGERRGRSWMRWMPVAIAAALAVLVWGQFNRGSEVPQYTAFQEEVAGAIAMRHNNRHDFKISAGSFEEVQGGLKDLVFSVQPSIKQKLLSAYELVGARLCQLEGQQAAHMQVRNRKTGTLCSLYIASLEGPLRRLGNIDTELDLEANHVDMWVDSGRLFALVD